MYRYLILILISLVLFNTETYAQNFKNPEFYDLLDPSTRPIKIKEKGLTIETSVALETVNSKTNGNKIYYWFRDNKIMSTQGGYNGSLLHGFYSVTYRNNQLKESGKFKWGLKDGKWTEWNEDGYIKKIVFWSKGFRHGKTINYNDKGDIIDVVVYNRGQKIDFEQLSKKEKKKLNKSFEYKVGDNNY